MVPRPLRTSKLTEPEKRQLFRGILEKLQLLIDENDRHQGLGYNNLLFMATELLLLGVHSGNPVCSWMS